ANDAIGGDATGLGAYEAFGARGDSGGAGFVFNQTTLRWEIAGVQSHVIATGKPPDINDYIDGGIAQAFRRFDFSFGEIAGMTRAASFLNNFINPTLFPAGAAGEYNL